MIALYLFTKRVNLFLKIFQLNKGYFLILFSSVFLAQANFAQELNVLANLPDDLKESSGLLVIDDRVFTHNDSNGSNSIYEIDGNSGAILNSIEILGANNVDWEDICQDENYIYIADIGNNVGNRQDLKIYRILKSEFLNSSENKVSSEVINFKYKNQTDYSASPYDTNFDAEAIVAINNKIYLFSKNWTNFETDIYSIPTTPGNHEIEKVGNFNSEGLVTAATYNNDLDQIILTGYGEDFAFVTIVSNFFDDDFSNLEVNRTDLAVPYGNSFQVEAIDFIENDKFILSSEASYSGTATLFSYNLNSTLSIEEYEKIKDSIFPNPSSSFVKLKISNFKEAFIIDATGKVVKRTNHKKIYIGDLDVGVYILKAKLNESAESKSFKLIVN